MIDQKPKSRNIALECLRGGAALAVVFGHCAVAFGLPIWQLPQIAQLPFNGSSAVEFFFVLSGYVLTRAFVTNENWIGLLRSAAKRYFRLLGPVLLATLVSLLLFDLHAYRYEQLSKSVNSQWLYCFGSAYPPDAGWIPSVGDALWRGGVLVFFVPDNQYYDNPLGTIYYETIGSFMVFALAAVAVLVRRISVIWTGMALVAALVAVRHQPYYGGFVAGLALSIWVPRLDRKASLPFALLMSILGLIFLSYQEARGEYAWIGNLGLGGIKAHWFNLIGAALLILAVELSSSISQHLEGRIGAFLGRLSFPIYLMHFLVLGSLGSMVWLAVQPLNGAWYVTAMAATAVTVLVAVIVSLPVMAFDRWWVAAVNRGAASVIRPSFGGSILLDLQRVRRLAAEVGLRSWRAIRVPSARSGPR